MKPILALVTVAAAFGAVPVSAQDFTGATVNYSYYYPDSATQFNSTNYVVGPGLEIPNVAGDPAITLDISSNTILVNYYRAANWSNFSFNGWIISDQTNNLNQITGVSINPASNWNVFNQSNIAFTADTITVNWAGLLFDSSNSLLLDVSFASSVPEPAAWAMMLLGFGFIGYSMRRQRRLRATTQFA